MPTDVASILSASATAVYALISAAGLWLLARQIRDARRFGAAPALYALLKEMEEHTAAVRRLGEGDALGSDVGDPVSRALEFFERIEHLRSAGVLPIDVLRRAFVPLLEAQLADTRFQAVIRQDVRQHAEVLLLATRLRPNAGGGRLDRLPAGPP